MSAGKGDTPRPLSVPRDAFEAAYERTFGGAKNLRCVKCGHAEDDHDGYAGLCDGDTDVESRTMCGCAGYVSGAGA